MWRMILFGLAAPVLALAAYAATELGAANPQESRVVCCGDFKPGDDCLENCEIVGEASRDLRLTCCGNCQKGDDCLQKCAGTKASCCEVR